MPISYSCLNLATATGTTVLVLAGCSGAVAATTSATRTCEAPKSVLASVPHASQQKVRVWLNVSEHISGPWMSSGPLRLRRALDRWNALSLPVRLVEASSAKRADVIVHIIRRFPEGESMTEDLYPAAFVSRVASGTRTRVDIAESSPSGVRYAQLEQEATLLHELGHILGLPHAEHPLALMAERPYSFSLTPMDADLAHTVLGGCGAQVAAKNADGR